MRRSPLLDRLESFVGEWELESLHEGEVVATTRTTFEWIEDGAFLLQRSTTTVLADAPQAWHDNAPRTSTALIAADDGSDAYGYAYADSRGVSRVHAMRFDGREWTLTGKPAEGFHQRQFATVSRDAIDGRYERSADGVAWEVDFPFRYRRLSGT